MDTLAPEDLRFKVIDAVARDPRCCTYMSVDPTLALAPCNHEGNPEGIKARVVKGKRICDTLDFSDVSTDTAVANTIFNQGRLVASRIPGTCTCSEKKSEPVSPQQVLTEVFAL